MRTAIRLLKDQLIAVKTEHDILKQNYETQNEKIMNLETQLSFLEQYGLQENLEIAGMMISTTKTLKKNLDPDL